MYEDKDLRFLDPNTEIGLEIGNTMVQADFDDDCDTDKEMQENASRVLQKELARGITNFLQAKYDRQEHKFVHNWNAHKRF